MVYAVPRSCDENLPCTPGVFNITDINAGDGVVTVSWDSSAYATSYILMRQTSPNGDWEQICDTLVTSPALLGNTFTDSTVTNGTIYNYQVFASSGNHDLDRQSNNTRTASPNHPTPTL